MTPNIYQIPGCCSGAELCCDHMYCSTPGFLVLHHLPVCSNTCPLSWSCHPTISSSILLFSSSPQFFPASGFSFKSALHIRWPKYSNFSFSISPSNEYSGFISFRVDWFELLEDQGTLKSLLQHHSMKE